MNSKPVYEITTMTQARGCQSSVKGRIEKVRNEMTLNMVA